MTIIKNPKWAQYEISTLDPVSWHTHEKEKQGKGLNLKFKFPWTNFF